MKNILITAGAGFIGSHIMRRFVNNYPFFNIYNIENLTYTGNLDNLKDINYLGWNPKTNFEIGIR
tara:strand:- start:432 stop:626 length:195 start_codon:yes stop_codon:yes gene_type:complete